VVDQLRLQGKAAAPTCPNGTRWSMPPSIPIDEVTIAMVGKYVDHKDAYKSLGEALKHGGMRQRTRVNLRWLEVRATSSASGADSVLAGVDGDPGAGRLRRARLRGQGAHGAHARENRMPYFGICYGMQAAVVDVARHVAGLDGANSTENDRATRIR
jgi:CTP synthase